MGRFHRETMASLRFALALALACFAVANGTGEQVTPDSDTPLAPTGKYRQLRTEFEEMRSTMKATEERHGKEMKATEERHGKEIAKLEMLVNANVQSEPRAANADVKARLLPAARPMHQHGLVPLGEDAKAKRGGKSKGSCDWKKAYVSVKKKKSGKYLENGDRKWCSKPLATFACHDKKNTNHRWAQKWCKVLCNPHCTPTKGCPYDLTKWEDHKDCTDSSGRPRTHECDPKHKQYSWATERCRKMCNTDCNPALLVRSKVTAIPSATLPPGHRNCADKYTIQTRQGDTSNRQAGVSVPVGVCARCKDDTFHLAPSYSVGQRVFGVCTKLTGHVLWHTAAKECNNAKTPCVGEKFRKCDSFMGNFGNIEAITKKSYQKGQSTPVNDNKMPTHGTPYAFTCARVWGVDVPDIGPTSKTNGRCFGSIHRLAQSSILSCFTTNENVQEQATLKCVLHKETKSCHSKQVDLGLKKNRKNNHGSCKKAWKQDTTGKKKEAYDKLNSKGLTSDWSECSEMVKTRMTALY